MKRLYKLLIFVLTMIIGVTSLVGCNTTNNPPTTASADEFSYVSMRINPEIELVVNKDGVVVAVNAINEDGETVLAELDLVGLSIEDAGEQFTAKATELGFIDVASENATVYVLAEGKNKEFVDGMKDKITKKINSFFDKKGIFGKVSPEELEKYQALATEWGVDLKTAKIVSRILELYPEMELEEILSLSFKEQIDLIKKDKHDLTAGLREEYMQAVEALKEKYAELFDLFAQLKQLKESIKNPELTETEVADINAQIETIEESIKSLKALFEEELSALKETMKEAVSADIEEARERAHSRREQFKDKIEEHENHFNDKKEEIQEQIKNWRENA